MTSGQKMNQACSLMPGYALVCDRWQKWKRDSRPCSVLLTWLEFFYSYKSTEINNWSGGRVGLQ